MKGEFIVQTRYEYGPSTFGGELAQYSNSFVVEEDESVEIDGVAVSTHPQSLVFDLRNDSTFPFWFASPCSSAYVQFGGSVFSDDGFLSLQHLVEDGAWHLMRLAETDCDGLTEPFQIAPGQDVTIDGTGWFQEKTDEIGCGTYRWDVVFYLEEYDAGAGSRGLRNVRHVFSEPFEFGE